MKEEKQIVDNQGVQVHSAEKPAGPTPSSTQDDQPHCLLADASVFIGTTTMPMHKQGGFLKDLTRFFHNYRTNTAKLLSGDRKDEFLSHFYHPMPYVLLGPFDLAVLALMEDYEFGAQTFGPFDRHWLPHDLCGRQAPLTPDAEQRLRDQELTPFAHRIILGPCPSWTATDDLLEVAKKTFLNDSSTGDGEQAHFVPRLPLIGICQVEVNTSLMVGGGADYLRSLVKAIRSEFRAQRKAGDKSELLILESYSWHELTILVFSDSYKRILDFIADVRKMTLLDIGIALCRPDPGRDAVEPKSDEAEWRNLRSLGNVYGLYETKRGDRPAAKLDAWLDDKDFLKEVGRQCPNPMLVDKVRQPVGLTPTDLTECLKVPPFGTHAFFNTTTTVGFWAGYLEKVLGKQPMEPEEAIRAVEEDEGNVAAGLSPVADEKSGEDAEVGKGGRAGFYLIRRWTTKAGHEEDAKTALSVKNGGGDEQFVMSVGRADFFYPCKPGDESVEFVDKGSRGVLEEMLKRYRGIAQAFADCQATEPDNSRFVPSFGKHGESCSGVLAVNTAIAFKPKPIPTVTEGHISADNMRRRMAYGYDRIEKLYDQLRRLVVPRVVLERAHNSLALVNEGILDNFLFSSFLELRPYVERLVDYVAKCDGLREIGKLDSYYEWQKEINQLVMCFVKGWRNRFYGGWQLGDLSDFNLEFKGGVQQLVSAFHAAYRAFSWCYTGELRALAIVTGTPGIKADRGALHLTFNDIFKPGFFAGRVGHEASEQLLALTGDDSDVHLGADFDADWLARLGEVRKLTWNRPEGRRREEVAGDRLRRAFENLSRTMQHPGGLPPAPEMAQAASDALTALESVDDWLKSLNKLSPRLNIDYDFATWYGKIAKEVDRRDFITELLLYCDRLKAHREVDPALNDAVLELLGGAGTADDLRKKLDSKDRDAWARLRNLTANWDDARQEAGDVSKSGVLAERNRLLLKHKLTRYQGLAADKSRARVDVEKALRDIVEVLDPILHALSRLKRRPMSRPLRAMCLQEPDLKQFLDEEKPRLFDQVFADICNYVVVFGGDPMLYSYSSMASIIVDPDSWIAPQRLDLFRLQEGLLRLFLAIGSQPDGRDPEASVWTRAAEDVDLYWAELTELLDDSDLSRVRLAKDQVIPRMLELAKSLRCQVRPYWFEAAHHLASAPLGYIRCCDDRRRFEQFLAERGFNEKLVSPPRGAALAEWVRADLGMESPRFRQAHALLKEGRGYRAGGMRPLLEQYATAKNIEYPWELDRWFDFCDVVVLLRAYLGAFRETSVAERRKGGKPRLKNVARRDKDGRIVSSDSETYAPSQFDQRGGTITIDADFRRRAMQLRHALTMSLLDLAEKSKLIYCREVLLEQEGDRLAFDQQQDPLRPGDVHRILI